MYEENSENLWYIFDSHGGNKTITHAFINPDIKVILFTPDAHFLCRCFYITGENK